MKSRFEGKFALAVLLLTSVVASAGMTVLPVEAATATILVNKTIVLTASFDGGGNIYKHGPSLGDYPVFRLMGSGVTLKNAVIDDANYIGTYAAVVVSGDSNRIQYCTLRNCLRYGFTSLDANHFYIGHNVVESAQYGVSGSGGTSYNGVIEYNQIKGVTNSGFKVKNMQNVVISNNYVDLTPLYVGRHPDGVNFSDDSPNANMNVVVSNNDFVRTGKGVGGYTYGITVDSGCSMTGNKVINNRFTNTIFSGIDSRMFGAIVKGDNFLVSGNTYTKCVGLSNAAYPVSLVSGAVNNVIKPNTVL
jgi:hypothetical protein